VSTTWSGRRHKHDHSILTTFRVELGGKGMSRVGYRECACGHRVLAVVTDVPAPRIGDKPYAEYAEMSPRLQQLRRPLTLRADQKAYDKHLGPRRGPNGDSRKLRSWLREGAIPLARLAALLSSARLCLIQPARIRRAANTWRDGKSDRALDDISAPVKRT
jgi:hypothetical protein